jgi:hypothetical protein
MKTMLRPTRALASSRRSLLTLSLSTRPSLLERKAKLALKVRSRRRLTEASLSELRRLTTKTKMTVLSKSMRKAEREVSRELAAPVVPAEEAVEASEAVMIITNAMRMGRDITPEARLSLPLKLLPPRRKSRLLPLCPLRLPPLVAGVDPNFSERPVYHLFNPAELSSSKRL